MLCTSLSGISLYAWKKKTEYLATYILRGFSTFMFNNVYVSYVTVIYKQMISYLVVKKCSFLCYFCNFLWHLLLWYVNITTKGATYCAIKIILIRFLKKAPSIQIMQKKIHFTETNSKQFIHVNEFNPSAIKKWCCIQYLKVKTGGHIQVQSLILLTNLQKKLFCCYINAMVTSLIHATC